MVCNVPGLQAHGLVFVRNDERVLNIMGLSFGLCAGNSQSLPSFCGEAEKGRGVVYLEDQARAVGKDSHERL